MVTQMIVIPEGATHCSVSEGGVILFYTLAAAVKTDGNGLVSARTVQADNKGDDHQQPREFRRARYVTALHHRAHAENVRIGDEPLTDLRLKVLRAVHSAGKDGILARQLRTKTKLSHGSLCSTLDWLRQHELVVARDATPKTAAVVAA